MRFDVWVLLPGSQSDRGGGVEGKPVLGGGGVAASLDNVVLVEVTGLLILLVVFLKHAHIKKMRNEV